jgi:hypothetical protein
MRHTDLLLALCVCAVGANASVAGNAAELRGSSAWRQGGVWDDGNAEFCAYEIEWQRYGRANPGRALLIAVKEPWAPELEVKADSPRPDSFDVIKLNHVRDVSTGIYTYHQMASTFVRRDSGELQKLAVTSSEGCGISTAQLTDGELNTRSYFDGQGERTIPFPGGALPVDGLSLSLRDYLEGSLPRSLDIFPSLMTGRFPSLRSAEFELQGTAGSRTVPAGTFETVEIELAGASGSMRYSFAIEPPHPLVHYEDSEGTTYRLAKCERIPYWEMNQSGGENWLPQGLR